MGKVFSLCPYCGKKGWYQERGHMWPWRVHRCRYCKQQQLSIDTRECDLARLTKEYVDALLPPQQP